MMPPEAVQAQVFRFCRCSAASGGLLLRLPWALLWASQDHTCIGKILQSKYEEGSCQDARSLKAQGAAEGFEVDAKCQSVFRLAHL